jgi:hypothetical protein
MCLEGSDYPVLPPVSLLSLRRLPHASGWRVGSPSSDMWWLSSLFCCGVHLMPQGLDGLDEKGGPLGPHIGCWGSPGPAVGTTPCMSAPCVGTGRRSRHPHPPALPDGGRPIWVRHVGGPLPHPGKPPPSGKPLQSRCAKAMGEASTSTYLFMVGIRGGTDGVTRNTVAGEGNGDFWCCEWPCNHNPFQDSAQAAIRIATVRTSKSSCFRLY